MCDYTSVEVDREEYRGLWLKIGLQKRSTTLGIQNFRDSAHTLGSFRWQCSDRDKRIFLDRLLDRFAKQDLFADSFFEIGDICCDLGMGIAAASAAHILVLIGWRWSISCGGHQSKNDVWGHWYLILNPIQSRVVVGRANGNEINCNPHHNLSQVTYESYLCTILSITASTFREASQTNSFYFAERDWHYAKFHKELSPYPVALKSSAKDQISPWVPLIVLPS